MTDTKPSAWVLETLYTLDAAREIVARELDAEAERIREAWGKKTGAMRFWSSSSGFSRAADFIRGSAR